MNLRDLEYIVSVGELKHFSRAAERCNVSQPTLSSQIKKLEDELGARLFHRTTRKQSLTETGNIYFQHALRIVSDIEEARLAVSQLTNMPSGLLHVTAEADFATAYIAPVLPDFLEKYPKIRIRFSMSAGRLDVVEGAIDLAIRFGHLGDSGLIARKIATSRSLICASPAYISRHGAPTHPEALARHNCLSFRTLAGKHYWHFEKENGSIEVPISGNTNANSLAFLRASALAGQGIIMIPHWMVRDELQHIRLLVLLKEFPLLPSHIPINAVFAHSRHLAPKVRAFVDFLSERMQVF